ncbi:MAG: hypothetical protein K9K66_10305 [Desulfarculaceae bacterium]|nr:hypothetical protein [Desulfarculaceae bacterium]MCF8073800.1 hypothetical protein [Desulfarculaceae bacterium]MCF8102041.1 hypothetical protein [Desulfarculaceae bacterium]MCF8116011.1 hypothetical protein [Desulfarculaceae bacterium]
MPTDPVIRPRPVSTAVLLLYISIGVALLGSLLEIPAMHALSGQGATGPVLIITLFIYAFIVLLVLMIGQGRGWARLVYTILFAIGLAMMAAGLTRPGARGAGMALGLLQGAIQLVAVVLLFLPASNAWFQAKKLARKKS